MNKKDLLWNKQKNPLDCGFFCIPEDYEFYASCGSGLSRSSLFFLERIAINTDTTA